jgi:Mg/Co/Ni transporter MgtE
MSNTVQLKGEALFTHLVKNKNMKTYDAIWEMIDHKQDMEWFDSMNTDLKNAVLNNDKGITAYIRS